MTTVLTNPMERVRFLRFMAVGAFGAIVDFGIANLLTHFLQMPLVLAGTISLGCAIISNFIWNRYWTYPESRSKPLAHQLGMFTLVNLAGVAIRIPILHFAEPLLLANFKGSTDLAGFSLAFVSRNVTLAIAVGIVMLWNFFINRYWTYNDID
jgi:putative flippase GtrA